MHRKDLQNILEPVSEQKNTLDDTLISQSSGGVLCRVPSTDDSIKILTQKSLSLSVPQRNHRFCISISHLQLEYHSIKLLMLPFWFFSVCEDQSQRLIFLLDSLPEVLVEEMYVGRKHLAKSKGKCRSQLLSLMCPCTHLQQCFGRDLHSKNVIFREFRACTWIQDFS